MVLLALIITVALIIINRVVPQCKHLHLAFQSDTQILVDDRTEEDIYMEEEDEDEEEEEEEEEEELHDIVTTW